MFVVFYTVQNVYICVIINALLEMHLWIHWMCDVYIILLSHMATFLFFIWLRGQNIMTYTWYSVDTSVCCVISWKVLLARLCYSFHCLIWNLCQWEKRTTHSTCSRARARAHTHTHTRTRAHTRTHTHTRARTHTRAHTHTRARARTHTHTSLPFLQTVRETSV
jgi:hypothetical protein